ncbi:Bug family tripartite tricarboxylate transporter substrate binding protein [Xenophilus azovorans]|uniref:Bug family tripartite tricarboxylate transporter substrate binding protein n=1 Tax=Xenophilus azovorans TaxID=151755 RepID=UPI0009FEACAC|nr:tripartite tricarboxylate transporter substrate binding protein [Xenophilus azovorans]
MLPKFLRLIAVFSCIAANVVISAEAQDAYPAKPLKMIVPYGAGGPIDVHARIIALHLRDLLGQPVIVENKPGALTSIGNRALSEANPDGYTFGWLTLSAVVLPITMKEYQIDPVKGFTPITQYNFGDYSIVVNNKVPVNNFAELVAYAKANPKTFNIATSGGHLDMVIALLGEQTGVNWSIIRYKGLAEARTALLAGDVDAAIDVFGFAKDQAAAGKIKFIAVTGPERNPDAPNVKTVAETSLPGFKAGFWWGFGGPPGMPPAAVEKLNSALRKAVELADVRTALRRDGTRAATGSPEDFIRFITAENKLWRDVAKANNISWDINR